MKTNEHLIDLVITFTHENITSIQFRTDLENTVEFGIRSSSTSISKLDRSSTETNVIFGFETGFSEQGLTEIFIYRGAIIKRKKSATVISAEKYHKLVLKNNSDNLTDLSPNKNNEKKNNDFKKLVLRRLNEINGDDQIEEIDKAFDLPNKTENDEIWNEDKLADQEQAQFEAEEEQIIVDQINIRGKKRKGTGSPSQSHSNTKKLNKEKIKGIKNP